MVAIYSYNKSMKNLPKYRSCFVCGENNPIGLNVTFQTDGEKVFVPIVFKRKYCGYENRIHGGIVSGLLDEAMGWACTVKTKRMYYTVELRVRFKNPVEPEKELTVEAHFEGEKHGICVAKGILRDNDSILATAEGKYFPLTEQEEQKVLELLHHEPEDGKPVTKDDF